MPITKATASSIAPAAKGDLVVGSATNDAGVLAVGTNTHILVADSTETLGMKWAAPSSGALALITAQAIGNAVASVTVSSAFSTTYDSYRIILSDCVSSVGSGNAIKITLGSASTAYYYAGVFTSYNSTVSGLGGSNVAFWLAGSLDNGPSNLAIDIYQPYLAKPTYFDANNNFITGRAGGVWGCQNANTSYTAFTLTPESGTFTGGTVYVYGYAKA